VNAAVQKSLLAGHQRFGQMNLHNIGQHHIN
jgi:hypothetical protein